MAKAPAMKKATGWGKAGVKRPKNAYTFFTTSFRKTVKDESVRRDISKFSALASERWAKMSEKEKAPFYADAAKERAASVEILMATKDAQKKQRMVARTKLPSGWVRVLGSDKIREHFLNEDADLICFGKPYTMEDAKAHMKAKPAKDGSKAKKTKIAKQ